MSAANASTVAPRPSPASASPSSSPMRARPPSPVAACRHPFVSSSTTPAASCVRSGGKKDRVRARDTHHIERERDGPSGGENENISRRDARARAVVRRVLTHHESPPSVPVRIIARVAIIRRLDRSLVGSSFVGWLVRSFVPRERRPRLSLERRSSVVGRRSSVVGRARVEDGGRARANRNRIGIGIDRPVTRIRRRARAIASDDGVRARWWERWWWGCARGRCERW